MPLFLEALGEDLGDLSYQVLVLKGFPVTLV